MAAGPTLSPGAAFGRYALPSDDLAGTATSVTVGGGGSPAAEEDPDYPASNLIAPTNTGHLNLPSRPAKMLTFEGYWELTFDAPITVGALHLVYHNLDEDLDVTLEPDGGTPIDIIIPAHWENGWTPSPTQEFDQQTSDVWRLSINEANSELVRVGRLLLYESLRDLGNDVRWGVVEHEEQGQIEHVTEGGVELLYELFGPRRSFEGDFALMNDTSASLISLFRDARNRILPWSLLPDADIPGDGWFVRFQENRWSRTREMIQHNIFPFRVKELSRGLPWP